MSQNQHLQQNDQDSNNQIYFFQDQKLSSEKYYDISLSVYNQLFNDDEMLQPKIETYREIKNNQIANKSLICQSQGQILQKIQEQDEDNYEELYCQQQQNYQINKNIIKKENLSSNQIINSDRTNKSKMSQAFLNENSFISLSDSNQFWNNKSEEYYSTGQSSDRNILNMSCNYNTPRTQPNLNTSYIFDSQNKNQSKLNYYIENIEKNQNINRKNQSVSYEDQPKFEIQEQNILNDLRTTLMIKNIPNKYNSELLRQQINFHFEGKYDFFYLPMDLLQKCNMGYAFINLINKKDILQFYQEFNNMNWDKFRSKKICKIVYARIQGKEELEQHFKDTKIYNKSNNEQKPFLLQTENQNNKKKNYQKMKFIFQKQI